MDGQCQAANSSTSAHNIVTVGFGIKTDGWSNGDLLASKGQGPLFGAPNKEAMYTTLLMSTGLTFGTISSLFGLSHGIIDKRASAMECELEAMEARMSEGQKISLDQYGRLTSLLCVPPLPRPARLDSGRRSLQSIGMIGNNCDFVVGRRFICAHRRVLMLGCPWHAAPQRRLPAAPVAKQASMRHAATESLAWFRTEGPPRRTTLACHTMGWDAGSTTRRCNRASDA
jgi:hypothetical protein